MLEEGSAIGIGERPYGHLMRIYRVEQGHYVRIVPQQVVGSFGISTLFTPGSDTGCASLLQLGRGLTREV